MSKYKGYTEKNKEWSMKYMKEKRDSLTMTLPLGTKERYRKHIAEHYPPDTSLTSVFMELMERDIAEKS